MSSWVITIGTCRGREVRKAGCSARGGGVVAPWIQSVRAGGEFTLEPERRLARLRRAEVRPEWSSSRREELAWCRGLASHEDSWPVAIMISETIQADDKHANKEKEGKRLRRADCQYTKEGMGYQLFFSFLLSRSLPSSFFSSVQHLHQSVHLSTPSTDQQRRLSESLTVGFPGRRISKVESSISDSTYPCKTQN